MKKLFYIIIFLAFLVIPLTNLKASTPIRILLVPGHDNEVWGAQYGNVKEAAMNLAVASRIFNILKKDKKFQVYITRDTSGYTKEFADYFVENKDAIKVFRAEAKAKTQKEIAAGIFIPKTTTPHNSATEDMAIKLYGINKWANENKMDAVIHIHFNDYPRATKWTIGKYTGFTVYFPDGQLVNWMESSQLGASIFIELDKKYSTSTLPTELGGLVPDQKLIALGSNGTLLASVRSVLVEYGYIYEKKFRVKSSRLQAYTNMANLTATGIKNYFFPKK